MLSFTSTRFLLMLEKATSWPIPNLRLLLKRKNNNVCMEKDCKRELKVDEHADVKRKRDSSASCIKVLKRNVEKYSFEAEEKQDITYLSETSAL